MADRLLEHMPELAGRLEIVGGAVDTDLFHPPVDDTDVDRDSVVYVGRIAPEKGILELLAAFHLLLARRPHTHLLICGGTGFGLRNPRTDYLRQVRAAVDELSTKWPRSLDLLGPLDHERELPAILRRAAVGVFPSVGDEAMPLAVLEAMSSGLPVVASDFGGLSEAVGDTGALVDPTDPDEMAAALYRLLEDREAARALGDRARERACSHFTWANAGRRLSEVVMSLPAW